MTVFRLILAAGLLSGSLAAQAQPGEQNFDDIDIIALPSRSPDKPTLSLNWSCDAITLSSSQRYRPNNCVERGRQRAQTQELDVETIGLEQPTASNDTPRRFR